MNEEELALRVSEILNETGAYKELNKLSERVSGECLEHDFVIHIENTVAEEILKEKE